jgi:hypothetical protein
MRTDSLHPETVRADLLALRGTVRLVYLAILVRRSRAAVRLP